ncbi:MAG: GIY-YIG nuclease family protein, partial [Phenylobacterium sp.]|nr:GIY-YIG nuclease family protein [Phenylobacterium sp.]
TSKYGVDKLVWFQSFELRENAFRRERQIKEWRRIWKLRLIEETNPEWRDLGHDLNNLLVF